jgi:hypothetical protein
MAQAEIGQASNEINGLVENRVKYNFFFWQFP